MRTGLNQGERKFEAPEVSRDGLADLTLDSDSLAALHEFFQLLDRWDRESEVNQ
jgi:hypothetical protein